MGKINQMQFMRCIELALSTHNALCYIHYIDIGKINQMQNYEMYWASPVYPSCIALYLLYW